VEDAHTLESDTPDAEKGDDHSENRHNTLDPQVPNVELRDLHHKQTIPTIRTASRAEIIRMLFTFPAVRVATQHAARPSPFGIHRRDDAMTSCRKFRAVSVMWIDRELNSHD
jgi:hypothetical protein